MFVKFTNVAMCVNHPNQVDAKTVLDKWAIHGGKLNFSHWLELTGPRIRELADRVIAGNDPGLPTG